MFMKKPIRILSLLILLSMLIGVIYYAVTTTKFNFKKTTIKQAKKSAMQQRGFSKEIVVSGSGTMVNLGSFTTNLSQNGLAGKFLITEISAQTDDEEASYELQKKKVLVRDTIIRQLSLKTFSQLSSTRAKEKLKQNIQNELNNVLNEGEVQEIYFTKFIIQ